MKAAIRSIGNSKGVIIPASFLAETGLEGEVEMTMRDHEIVISPSKEQPRKGWFDGYQVELDSDPWEDFVVLPEEEEEWEW
ncbi:MAG: AbrB/MazE/SpoVT family DNA-binding domain-containing protein [Gammaproteobacteria bacterium]|jgi:antitoxin MazE|nr:AbrB/MazE/SpoVT family DNA-binding domain-containing protein [Gammaproteobacteria bacterium]MBT5235415.1 AbrB/MazE/SpoVT family DNA-binding domain-containing protein [Candidatus Neomarinimicrobiota bacterium]MBT3489073.1 AbrB/MazE/SpoVT family DNA-binding domain-containing protein [Gammaproteobacteria bacterium]MBT3719775.1 AbrB/MazE/SpoVT family DNA-binding domain-containing protein [Gammaproteobacteria bacterium]MBT3845642.1 AbrB/MazE/SpoVT family DNA-binding domain-containing protein [Gam